MRLRGKIGLAAILAIVALLGVGGFFAWRYLNVDALRAMTERRLEAITGRDVAIEGDFDLALSLVPTLVAEGVVVANAEWGSRPAMLDADRIEVTLQAWPLLWDGDVLIDRLAVRGADLLLETDAKGRANWTFATLGAADEPATERQFLLDEVAVQDSRLTWRDLASDQEEVLTVDHFGWRADSATALLEVSGEARIREQPVAISGELGPLADLVSGTGTYPVALQGTLDGIQASTQGTVDFGADALNLTVELAGERAAALGDLLEVQLPPVGGFALEAAVTGPLDAPALVGLSGQVGQAGGLRAEVRDGRIADLLKLEGIALQVRVEGPAVAELGDLIELELPQLGPYAVEGRLAGSLDRLALVDLAGQLGDQGSLHLELVEGRIANLLEVDGIDVVLVAQGPSLANLGDVLGAELPALGPYRVQGRLTGSSEALALVGLDGSVGPEAEPALRFTEGAIADLLAGQGIVAEIEATGEAISQLAEVFGAEMGRFGPYALEGRLEGSFEDLALRDLEATVGDQASRIELAGAIGDLMDVGGFELRATVEGSTLAGLSPLVGIELPESEPYSLSGEVTGSLEELRVQDLEGRVADSALSGWLAVALPEESVPAIEGEIRARRLDLDRLLALVGSEEATEEVTEAAEPAADGVFPDEPLPLGALDEAQVDLVVAADELVFEGTRLQDASLNLVLQDGRLSVRDLVLQVAGGSVAGDVAVEAEGPQNRSAEVMLELNAQGIRVSDLLAGDRVTGEIDLNINIDGTGRSIDEIADDLEGSAALVAEEGEVRDAPLDLLVADLDVLRALPALFGGDSSVNVNCLITELDIEEGVARTEALLDTRRMTLLGKGTIDLAEERLDLALRPRAKSEKLSTLAVPVDVHGSLAAPSVEPQVGTAAGQAVRGILGGLLIPLNQLSALFGEETADACADALRQARERRGTAAPAEPGPAPAEERS